MSANYGRRLFTWGHCLFFLYYGLLLHGVCAFFSHFFAFISSLNSKNRFFHSTALDCVLFGVFLSDRELFLQNHPAPLREEKRTKKEVESDSPEGLFFRNGILLESFLYASALLFRSDANIGKWDKLEEIHSPG